jgi:indole-3-glycerol phosphate synthase
MDIPCFLFLVVAAVLSLVSGFQSPPVTLSQSALSRNTRLRLQDEVIFQQPARSSPRKTLLLLDMSSSSSSSSVDSAEQTTNDDASMLKQQRPQAMASGYSQAMDMAQAIQDAVAMALEALPPPPDNETAQIDLAIVSVSSLYDGSASPSTVVPTVLEAASSYGKGIQHLVGSTCGGFISSRATFQQQQTARDDESDDDDEDEKAPSVRLCAPVEQEGVPGVSVVLAILPDVKLQTFHVMGDDVPDNYGKLSSEDWQRSIGLSRKYSAKTQDTDTSEDDSPAIFLIPSPAFSPDLDDLLRGFGMHLPGSTVFGAIASTVSSLSRARLFRHDASSGETHIIQTLADGCVGVFMSGDIQVKTMVAQGAKPVGGVYQIVKGQESTIAAIALDEATTEMVRQAEILEGSKDDDDEMELETDNALQMDYAKARIPKPTLAEANFLMKTLSDDDQAFMRKALLVGIERGGSLGRTPSELARLAEGRGHNFVVQQVATAAMKDGSVTLPLGSLNIERGTRMRFYVRESNFAKREVEAIWTGYKKKVLSANIKGHGPAFVPSACLLFPTLDRGNKFFQGKSGFESTAVAQFLPTTPCISGFFSNGIIGTLSSNEAATTGQATLHGSASTYVLIGSKSNRPIFYPTKGEKDKDTSEKDVISAVSPTDTDGERRAPRDSNGELIIKRREVHSGRALTVSTVEWSVAEKAAVPSSALEGFMWDKETEVDRFRERVPLANLLSQCKLSAVDPTQPKPRDWIGPVKKATEDGTFVIIPEAKRTDPASGSLWKRYDLSNLVQEFVSKNVPAISVNCDAVLFGGSLEDITKAREACSKAALEKASTAKDGSDDLPPIFASDLILYPYQLYKLRLAGADAVNMLVGSLATKDLVYLVKIAKSVQMQSLLTLTSTTQLENVSNAMDAGSVDGIIVSNRNLEDYSFDMTGQQALSILGSDEMKAFREKHGDALVLVEGRVGIIEAKGEDGSDSSKAYIEQLKQAGANGAIVGGGLAPDTNGPRKGLQSFQF